MIQKFSIKPNSPSVSGIVTDTPFPGLYLVVWSVLITRCPDGGGVGSLRVGLSANNAVERDEIQLGMVEGVNNAGNRFDGTTPVQIAAGEVTWTLAPDQNFDGTDYSGTLRLALVGPL